MKSNNKKIFFVGIGALLWAVLTKYRFHLICRLSSGVCIGKGHGQASKGRKSNAFYEMHAG
jgi:hypothetical protein